MATVSGLDALPLGTESSLSNWAGPYVTDMLGRGWALADTPYTAYQGELTAGESPLQQQAFSGLANLVAPTNTSAGMENVVSGLGNLSYNPSTFDSGFNYTSGFAPSDFSSGFTGGGGFSPMSFDSGFTAPAGYTAATFNSGFNAPADYAAATFNSGFTAPDAFSALTNADVEGLRYIAPGEYTPGEFQGGIFDLQQAQHYMNPFLRTALDPHLEELQRRADIQRMQDAGRMTQAGAFGGSRQAILEAELNRNTIQEMSKVTGDAYRDAYDKAFQAFESDQSRRLQAEGMGEQSRQFAADYAREIADASARFGIDAARLIEQSRQFGATHNLSIAEIAARMAMDEQTASEQSRQFGADLGFRSADAAARHSLEAQRLQEQSQQFGADLGFRSADAAARHGLEAQRLTSDSQQFGADLGFRTADAAARHSLEAQRLADASRQAAADIDLRAADLGSRHSLEAQRLQELSRQFGAGFGLDALKAELDARRHMGDAQRDEFNMALQALQSQLIAGQTQRNITQDGITADIAQFERERDYPYTQVQYMQSLLQGLPVGTQATQYQLPSGTEQFYQGIGGIAGALPDTAAGIMALYEALFGGGSS